MADYIDGIEGPGFVISMMVGDTQRVIEYPKLGHALPQEVPRPIEAALERLIAAGFTDRLLPAASRTSPLDRVVTSSVIVSPRHAR